MLRGEKMGYEEGEQKAPSTHVPNFGKHLADSRRSFSPSPPPLALDSAGKSSPRVMKMLPLSSPPLTLIGRDRGNKRLHSCAN